MIEFFKNINFEIVGNVITSINPVAGLVVKSIDTIVKSKNEHISNESTIKILESLSKSTKNDVDDKVICMVKTYLECRK